MAESPYKSFDKLILRAPLLGYGFYDKLTKTPQISDSAILKVFSKPIVKEAIFLASPSLYFEAEKWALNELDKKKYNKVRLSLLKYFTRLSTRCTPFGLFAGCAVGSFGEETKIAYQNIGQTKRHTRLDMNYMVALSQNLSRNRDIEEKLLFYPNSSIYTSGNQLRYIEYYYVDSRRQHQIVEVDNSPYLQEILKVAIPGAYLNDLRQLIIEKDISEEEAHDFLEELVESQLLVSELEPSVSGPEFVNQVIETLTKIDVANTQLQILKNSKERLAEIDMKIGNGTTPYLDLGNSLEPLETGYELRYLFQTDLKLPTAEVQISQSVIKKLHQALVLLNRMTPPVMENNLTRFKEAFSERYEKQEVSLSKALDVETGIGYRQNSISGDINPLIDDLILPEEDDKYQQKKIDWVEIQTILHQKLIDCDKRGDQKISLQTKDFEEFPTRWDDLPDTFSTMIELHTHDGIEKIKFAGFGGSSAANLLGRFCYLDQEILDYTQAITKLEKQMNQDRVLAEIVHLPEARVGNILMRPSLREYEIPYLAKSAVPLEKQIPIEDLFLSVRNNRLVLKSKKLNKEVLPRLSNAHNYALNALPIYHFLSDLQLQGQRSGLQFSFGPLAPLRDFLPRVEYDDVILQSAQWRVKVARIQPLLKAREDKNSLKEAIKDFKDSLKLPSLVLLADGDNELLVNLENLSSVEMLLSIVKSRDAFLLTEFLFFEDSLEKSDSNKRTNQIIISFYNQNKLQDARG